METKESVDLRALYVSRSGFRSTEESRLLLENGMNLDDRRVLAGFEGAGCSIGGAVSLSGLEAYEELDEPPSLLFMVNFNSSSEMVPLNSSIGGSSSKSLTCGKYV
jgi:hypothetical protein